MPSHSAKQAKTMSAIAHGWHPTGSAAKIPVSVAKEFHAADAGKKWGGKHKNTAGPKVAQHWKGVYHRGHAEGGPTWQTPGGQHQERGEYEMEQMRPGMIADKNPYAGLMDLMNEEEGKAYGGNAFQLGGDIIGMNQRPGMMSEKNMFQGPIKSKVPGRTDKLRLDVKPGSYIMPADVISGIGEGNTEAGHSMVKALFTPHGLGASGGKMGGRGRGRGGFKMPSGGMRSQMPHGRGMGMTGLGGHRFAQPGMGMRPPRMSGIGTLAHGGSPHEDGDGVPIVAAGGEHVISPEEIMWKFGDLKRGHDMLDHFVKHMRAKHIKQLTKLPPPKK